MVSKIQHWLIVSRPVVWTLILYPSVVGAWQFRDLDSESLVPETTEVGELLDLMPTDQEFVAPIVDAPASVEAESTTKGNGYCRFDSGGA